MEVVSNEWRVKSGVSQWLVVSDEILEFRIHKSEIRVVDVLA